MRELVRGYLKVRGKHRALVSFKAPGKAGRAIREGANLAWTGRWGGGRGRSS